MPKRVHSFDDILVNHVGGFGVWQITIFGLVAIPSIFRSTQSMIQAMSGFAPSHRHVDKGNVVKIRPVR
jgi:hypothetical protein